VGAFRRYLILMSISRLAKQRGVPIVYQALTNEFAVLPDEAVSTPKAALTRRRRTRQAGNGDASGA